MAEETKQNEVTGIKDTANSEKPVSGKIGSNTLETASKGLNSAASFCEGLLILCVVMTILGGFIAFIGVVISRYLLMRICGWVFIYSIVSWFSCYILSKVLRGLAVMVEAAEKFLEKN